MTLSGEFFQACGVTRDYNEVNEGCQQPACNCLCHEFNGRRR